MKITIDTSVDSKDEIKKVINLLNHMVTSDVSAVGNNTSSVNELDPDNTMQNSAQNTSNGFMNLFGSDESTPLKNVVDERKEPSSQNRDDASKPKEERTNNGIRIIEY
jgi:hypothetical protein